MPPSSVRASASIMEWDLASRRSLIIPLGYTRGVNVAEKEVKVLKRARENFVRKRKARSAFERP
jgi:hypothetical protein